MVKLNETQNELLRISKENGFLTDNDFKLHYTSPITIKANIERFILMKIIGAKDDEGKYKYLGEQDE